MKPISDDAKMVAALFGVSPPFRLNFGMVEMRPTPRMQLALAELILHGILREEPLPPKGVSYTAIDDCTVYFEWSKSISKSRMTWKHVEAIPGVPQVTPPAVYFRKRTEKLDA